MSTEVEAETYTAAFGKAITRGCVLCNRCRLKGYDKKPVSDTAQRAEGRDEIILPRQYEPPKDEQCESKVLQSVLFEPTQPRSLQANNPHSGNPGDNDHEQRNTGTSQVTESSDCPISSDLDEPTLVECDRFVLS